MNSEQVLFSFTNFFGGVRECVPNITSIADNYPNEKSVNVSYWEIEKYHTALAEHLLNHPDILRLGEQAIYDNLSGLDIKLNLRIYNLPEETSRILIADIRAEHLNKFISVGAIVRKTTEVRPLLIQAIFQCARCYAILKKPQDPMHYEKPHECSKEQGGCGRAAASTKFILLKEKSTFIDIQKIELMENPENVKSGARPESLTCFVFDDLCGQVHPGDHIRVTGTLNQFMKDKDQAVFNICLYINHLTATKKGYEEIQLTGEDIEEIHQFVANDITLDERFIYSICPSIFGMEIEKHILALQLFGGQPKDLPDQTTLRGDIHVLLIGDPGTAKSKLMDFIGKLSPKAIKASARNSTQAGLIAAAVKDEFGGSKWTLEAGAMVLADKGMFILEELDKMNKADREIMNEALEQQVVNIAKAGITAELRTRCPLLASANPKFGRFDDYRPISEQFDLSPTLLSRFDMILPIQDKVDKEKDFAIAEHVLKMHLGGEISRSREALGDTHYNSEDEDRAFSIIEDIVSPEFIKKYIAYAKINIFPVMNNDVTTEIANFYTQMRAQGGDAGAVSITVRQLESVIRLCEASARMHLRSEITIEDFEKVKKLYEYFMRRIASEGGILDIDMIVTGVGHTQRGRIIKLIDVITDISNLNKNGTASLDDILLEVEKGDYTRDLIVSDLDKLTRDGRLFTPRDNEYRVA